MVNLQRDGRLVQLETFSSTDVAEYLNKALNRKLHKRRFKVLANSKCCKGILAIVDETPFIIYANSTTCIELSFNVKDTDNMSDVFETLKKWDKFSKTERRYVFDFKEQETHTTLFENGYTCLKNIEGLELSVTEF